MAGMALFASFLWRRPLITFRSHSKAWAGLRGTAAAQTKEESMRAMSFKIFLNYIPKLKSAEKVRNYSIPL
jgi:hypothetical protein